MQLSWEEMAALAVLAHSPELWNGCQQPPGMGMITGTPLPRDLLGKEPQEKLEIKLCPDGSGQLYVPGLTEFRVQSVEDINKVWGDGGGRHRRVAAGVQ